MTVTIAYGTSQEIVVTKVSAISATDKTILINYTDTATVNAPTTKQISTKDLGEYEITIEPEAEPTPEPTA